MNKHTIISLEMAEVVQHVMGCKVGYRCCSRCFQGNRIGEYQHSFRASDNVTCLTTVPHGCDHTKAWYKTRDFTPNFVDHSAHFISGSERVRWPRIVEAHSHQEVSKIDPSICDLDTNFICRWCWFLHGLSGNCFDSASFLNDNALSHLFNLHSPAISTLLNAAFTFKGNQV